ncbi:MFS transporter [Actinotignum urinale]|uniref:MFS transporter n=1 Tax=Actinotignum urinale TaxID=190146 RepID=UPI00370D6D53
MSESASKMTVVRTKPIMSMKNILLMNLGFFGIQYSFGMQQTAINPIYQMLGASPEDLPLLNLAGPVTGLLIQPLIGAMSDRTWSPKWGRRKPFFLIGAAGCSICLFLFPWVSAVWMAVMLLWALDASNNTAMEPYRAFISDRLPPSQLAKGFLAQSFFTGFGITLANICIWAFPKILPGVGPSGLPAWVYAAFLIGAVCSIGTVLISVWTTPELPPTESELAELKAKKESGGFGAAVKEIWEAIRDMPTQLRKLALVYLFQWYAMQIYWQYISLSVGKSIYGVTDPLAQKDLYAEAVATTGSINAFYNVVTFCVAFILAAMARRYGAKILHCVCLLGAAVVLMVIPHITNPVILFLPMVLFGIAWASIMGVPYIMAVRMIPSTRYGVYMGIINMMIVIPMLIQTVTFGPIYKYLLGSNTTNAFAMAAGLMVLAAVSMLWIKEPPIVRDVDAMFDHEDEQAATYEKEV